MQTQEETRHANSFGPLWRDLKARLLKPVGQVSFWAFLFFGVFLLSACGVWVELAKYWLSGNSNLDGVETAINTFFPALACTSTMQIIFSEDNKKYLRSAGYAVGGILMLSGFVLLVFDKLLLPTVSILLGVIASVISILTWWVANGHETMFCDNVIDKDAPVGGDANAPLKGNTSNFKIS
jgi:hypothetical protein